LARAVSINTYPSRGGAYRPARRDRTPFGDFAAKRPSTTRVNHRPDSINDLFAERSPVGCRICSPRSDGSPRCTLTALATSAQSSAPAIRERGRSRFFKSGMIAGSLYSFSTRHILLRCRPIRWSRDRAGAASEPPGARQGWHPIHARGVRRSLWCLPSSAKRVDLVGRFEAERPGGLHHVRYL
jgi:hypothetical protein